jgi:hypothetical protein
MITLGERLDGIHIRVRVPGTEIEAELRDRTNVTIHFGRSVYEWLNEPHLEHYLATLARLLYTEWVRQYRAALSGSAVEVDVARHQEFFAAREQLTASGRSADGRVTISATGMQDFHVRIAPGTVRELGEREFVASTTGAVAAFLADQRAKIGELKERCFG